MSFSETIHMILSHATLCRESVSEIIHATSILLFCSMAVCLIFTRDQLQEAIFYICNILIHHAII